MDWNEDLFLQFWFYTILLRPKSMILHLEIFLLRDSGHFCTIQYLFKDMWGKSSSFLSREIWWMYNSYFWNVYWLFGADTGFFFIESKIISYHCTQICISEEVFLFFNFIFLLLSWPGSWPRKTTNKIGLGKV